uniref:Uncharacterized protein LOC104248885 n=1 Tax=Nicotiana sylvestris TaxID=4096 RepID=A0A1U7YHF7_NICSY|nr:PREDICTED: uncharacterized protein LOC104248885 [Nicotiana sylvestris]
MVQQEFISFLKNLLGEKDQVMPCIDLDIIRDGPCLSLAQQQELLQPITREEVLQFFESGKLLKEVNCTTITLVPKVANPTYLKDYMPIACFSTIYRLIEKVLTGRLKKSRQSLHTIDVFSFPALIYCFWAKSKSGEKFLHVAGVSPEFKTQIIQDMHFSIEEIPFKYLGAPLSSRKLLVAQCIPLVEKIIARIK